MVSLATKNVVSTADVYGTVALRAISDDHRTIFGQYFTPAAVASLMADMFVQRPRELNILDAGAGVGILTAALVNAACNWDNPPTSISVTAFELEEKFISYLREILEECRTVCKCSKIDFSYQIVQDDYITVSTDSLRLGSLFKPLSRTYNAAILNPPYHKIRNKSDVRNRLNAAGIETSNLYSAFVWLAIGQLDIGGEIVSITPRSFANGPYFRPFRQAFTNLMAVHRLHIFDARDRAFRDDHVLQENIIMHATRGDSRQEVVLSSSTDAEDPHFKVHKVDYEQVVHSDDPQRFIHFIPDEVAGLVEKQIRNLPATLSSLGLEVSTGRVVLFRARAKDLLEDIAAANNVPLIYPAHFKQGEICWPIESLKKPSFLTPDSLEENLLVPSGYYVLVKRFTSKEETRRVVAAVYDPNKIVAELVGFENHLNYFHKAGAGLEPAIARGLSTYLNSTLVDEYLRLFNGHTQINATDLRRLPYPSLEQIRALGERVGDTNPNQSQLDQLIREEITMQEPGHYDPIQVKYRIDEALDILEAIGAPRQQQNERSALTLLALMSMTPELSWQEVEAQNLGITEMMDYFSENFGKHYAPNTRETVRRQTIHQFVNMGLVILNPDKPNRPINSPHTCYRVDDDLLALAQVYGTDEWDVALEVYLEGAEERQNLHAQERTMRLIPVKLPDGREIKLTPGGQNRLIKKIVEEFCPRFTPGATIVYLDDAGLKSRGDALEYLSKLGVDLNIHGKMPDVIVHYTEKEWLVLIEAVTSHGPIDIKRHNELKRLFEKSTIPLVFVTAFLNRPAMTAYLPSISWETEVWVAASPSHLIHFNGERFLGPYSSEEK